MKYKKGDKMDKHLHGEALWATWLALGYIIEEVKEEEWPKDGDTYYYINEHGRVICDEYNTYFLFDVKRKVLGYCYRTEAEAQEAKARVERAYKGI